MKRQNETTPHHHHSQTKASVVGAYRKLNSNNKRIKRIMANQLKKLPPDVARELLRHVRPNPRISRRGGGGGQNNTANTKKSSTKILAGCTAFVAFAGSLPYWATQTIGNLSEKEEALTAAQVRRGAFMNSGSRDAGKDPNWDWKNGKYVYPKGFAEHLKKQNPKETDLGPDIGPMVREEQQRRR